MIDSFPRLAGSYALFLLLPTRVQIPVGRLGEQVFPSGQYLYLGSARGSGGLRARMRHHLGLAAKCHWHIDWLRSYFRLSSVWYVVEPDGMECAWSQALAGLPGAYIPARGFGASDCHSGCAAHLVGFLPGAPVSLIEDCLRLASKGSELFRLDLAGPIRANPGDFEE